MFYVWFYMVLRSISETILTSNEIEKTFNTTWVGFHFPLYLFLFFGANSNLRALSSSSVPRRASVAPRRGSPPDALLTGQAAKPNWAVFKIPLSFHWLVKNGIPHEFWSSPIFFFRSDMRLILSHTYTAAHPKLVTYVNFGVSRSHRSWFSAMGNKIRRNRVVSYHCFMLTKEKCLSSAMLKCW